MLYIQNESNEGHVIPNLSLTKNNISVSL